MAKKHLIIGSGPAALSALEEIRSLNPEDEIKLVTKEEYLPYSPSALPFLLAGRIKEDDIWLRDENYFRDINVDFVRGKEVIRVLPGGKEVIYKDGDSDKYDTLLIASGSRPASPPIKGLKKTGFQGFHILDHYHKLLQQLAEQNNTVAICGAGLVAIELAMALLERGNPVKVIEMENRILSRYFDEDIATIIEEVLRSHGAEIYTGTKVNEVRAGKNKIRLLFDNGSSLDSSILITATGVEPQIAFLEGSGVKVNRGVLVDSMMRTNIPDIYAAGDVVETAGFSGNETGVNPILPDALSQGRVAGDNMAGKETAYRGWIAMNIFDLFGIAAFSIGLSMPSGDGYEVLEEKRKKQKQFKKLVYKDNCLAGAMMLNVDMHPGSIRYLIENKVDIGSYKELLLKKPDETSQWLVSENERKQNKSI